MIGILTPYASGQNAVYYGSGFIKRRDFWVLGFVLGVVVHSCLPDDHREVAGYLGV
jgi:di/tricarboxylate transporter